MEPKRRKQIKPTRKEYDNKPKPFRGTGESKKNVNSLDGTGRNPDGTLTAGTIVGKIIMAPFRLFSK